MTTYRNPATVRACGLGTVVLVVTGIDSSIGVRILVAPVIAFVVLVALRPKLVTTPDGLVVTNLRRHRISWLQIEDIGVRVVRREETLVLVTGQTSVRTFAVTVGPAGGRRWCYDTVRAVQEDWHRATGRTPSVPV
jgi:hypothetical protein